MLANFHDRSSGYINTLPIGLLQLDEPRSAICHIGAQQMHRGFEQHVSIHNLTLRLRDINIIPLGRIDLRPLPRRSRFRFLLHKMVRDSCALTDIRQRKRRIAPTGHGQVVGAFGGGGAPRWQIGESVHAAIKPQLPGGLKVYLPRQTRRGCVKSLLRPQHLDSRQSGGTTCSPVGQLAQAAWPRRLRLNRFCKGFGVGAV